MAELTVGAYVHTPDGTYSGVVLGAQGQDVGAPAATLHSDGENRNLQMYAVEDPEFHEVRLFTRDGLVLGPAQDQP